jgi:hypothetical protein
MITTPGINNVFAKFEAQIRQFERYQKKSARDVLLKFQNQFAANLAFTTQPYGLKPSSEKKGQKAVERDIRAVYKSPAKVWDETKKHGEEVSKAVYAAIKNDEKEKAERILESLGIDQKLMMKFDGGNLHKAAKGALPKTLRGQRSMINLDEKSLRKYIKEIQQRVGFAKAGWVVALPSRRGIPDWVAKHRSLGFILDKTKFTLSPHLIFQNNVPWIKKLFKAGAYKQSFSRMAKQIEKEIIRMIKADAKKAKVTK